MSLAVIRDYIGDLACPSCLSYKLLPTKENIIICQGCLMGYKMAQGVPDFRLENAISFKKRISQAKSGVNAVVTILMGDQKNESFEIKLGHCVVVGRLNIQSDDDDYTVVGSLHGPKNTFSQLDSSNQKLVEKYLSKQNTSFRAGNRDDVLKGHQKFLGNFIRQPDVLLKDGAVSRSHAILYQDERGVHVIDLLSKNGSFINGQEVERATLQNNDILSMGNMSLRLQIYS